ncbi:ARM repeat-containing protein [Lindgomyces ingoldianus]|uniref:ARM repeat-containing protein n=1 Tax=Lindgomyces ingoldianus TaxID=673940 RepID=A0ACB6QXX0_9PLEO|nr:ARM repeat-containing protein [Lindgomyces ingoldianus]KAF2471370.1 ARM repeat-containing protein [Lindgomyces ingoldianus]
MEPGVVGRNMTAMSSNPRSRDFSGGVAINGAESDRPSHTALTPGFANTAGWGGSIWNNNTLGAGFGSAVRESSRPRENGTYISSPSDPIEGKTGSGSLVASSESDNWKPNRSPWGDNATGMPHARSSGVSPARKRSIAQTQSQQYADSTSSAYFPVSRSAGLNQGPVAKPPKPLLDPTSMNFSSTRQVDPLVTNGFSSFGFGQSDSNPQRSETTVGSWPDAGSVHSPNDDRRSITASEYFGPSSGTQSRSGSLPPSRHGAEPLQFAQNNDQYSRFTQPGPRQHSSFSHANGRAFPERSGSIQSDSLHLLSRMSIADQDMDTAMIAHKPSVSINGLPPAFTPSGNDSAFPRDTYGDSQSLARPEDGNYAHTGSYTPDSYANGHLSDPNTQFRSFQFDSRSAPNGTGVRQSPFYSHAHTPPVYDHLYPSRNDQTLANGNNIALFQSKLQGYQQQQERRNYINPTQFHQQHFQHLLATNQLRSPYGYAYSIPNGMQLNGMQPNLAMPAIPGMMNMIEAPRAPRDHAQPDGVVSKCLYDFKQNSKTSKRYELKDIYDHIVEFSGDQHGSRFIQQKLETANSDEKDRVFRELQGNALQLMQDVFGNYVIQKFFEHGDQTQKKILASRMKGQVWNLSLQMYGCRVVQKALEHILTDQQAVLVKELEKDVTKCVKDQNGNHVIQKAIERVPLEHIQFIIDAFHGQVGSLAVHPYGCRVIQRVLEYCEEPARRFILEELHAEGPKLITDQYGNYVTQHVIEHGSPDDRAKLISLVKGQLLVFSKHKFASNVVEKCLIFGTDDQRREIMLKVIEKPERGESTLMMLIKDNYGNYVIQKILETICRKDYDELIAFLKPEMDKAKKIISGKQVLSVEKKMHRFDRVDSVSSPTAQRNSISSATDISPTPPLTSDAQSPQSSSLPSTNTSTVDDPVNTTPLANKTLSPPRGGVSIANTSS